MKVNIISITPNPIEAIASAYGVTRGLSYKEFQKKYTSRSMQERMIADCIKSGHMTGLEFVSIDVELLGVSRVFETDAVRSRISSPLVEAGKFSEARNFAVVNPAGIYPDEVVAERQATIQRWNEEDKAKNIDPRFRRYFTYQGLERNMRLCKNFRAWVETSWLRTCACTQWEYRTAMSLIKQELNKQEPFLAQFLAPKCEHLGYCTEVWEPCGKYPTKDQVLK